MLGLNFLEARLLHEDTTVVAAGDTSSEGLHHATHRACTTVSLEATSGTHIVVDRHVRDLHLEHVNVVAESNVLGVAAMGTPCKELHKGCLGTLATHMNKTLHSTLGHASLARCTGTAS